MVRELTMNLPANTPEAPIIPNAMGPNRPFRLAPSANVPTVTESEMAVSGGSHDR